MTKAEQMKETLSTVVLLFQVCEARVGWADTAHSFASFLPLHSAPMPYFVGVHFSLLEVC